MLLKFSFWSRYHLGSMRDFDATCSHGPYSKKVQVMACWLTAQSHYLNQCWFIVIMVLGNSPKGNRSRNVHEGHHCNTFENYWRIYLNSILTGLTYQSSEAFPANTYPINNTNMTSRLQWNFILMWLLHWYDMMLYIHDWLGNQYRFGNLIETLGFFFNAGVSMMTSWYGRAFRVTDPLWEEATAKITSWHGNTLRVTDTLWWEPPVTSRFSSQ